MRSRLVLVVAVLACNDSQARAPAVSAAESAGVAAATGNPVNTAGGVAAESDESSQSARTMRLERVADRFRSPVHLIAPPGDPRLFVVEQAGRIRIVKNGAVVSAPFLDISERVRSGGEQGLLSMAFDPDFRRNGFFYVNFTDRPGDTHVERFKVGSNPDAADETSARLIIRVDQPYSNHNGGHILFGLDGMLYIGMGDGGSGGDPHRHGQNRRTLLGKLLRLDVSRGDPYSIPAGNPYTQGAAGRPEIWAIGLRNPWRLAFDRESGTLYIADVGQNRLEEIHVASAGQAGINYGWNVMEGDQCYGESGCSTGGLHIPQVTYGRAGGECTVIGGSVYRGRRIPAIRGHYFYSDYCAGWLRSFRYENGAVVDRREWTIPDIGNVVSFGEDGAGELYIIAENGRIFRFAGVN